MQTLILSIIIILLLIIATTTVAAAKSFAPWVPCRNRDLKRIFKLANLKPGEIFYDLGCGDGKTVIYAAKNFNAKAVGIEMAIPLFIICKIRQILNLLSYTESSLSFLKPRLPSPSKGEETKCLTQPSIIFKWKNLFNEDLSKADVIYFFGMPKTIKNKLKEKIKREAKPGARVISYVFKVDGWEPGIIDKPGKNELAVYLYKM